MIGDGPPREVQAPREAANGQPALPRELQCLVVDRVNHRTDHDAAIGRDTGKNRLQPVRTTTDSVLVAN